jgi:hypothetical protein
LAFSSIKTVNRNSHEQQEVAVAISEISNQGPLPQSSRDKKVKEPVPPAKQKGDKVELSSEAQSLFEAEQKKRLDEIQQKIDENFYFTPEVTRKVVDRMIKDILE